MCIDTSLIQFRQQIFADTLLPYHYTTPHNHPRDWICTLNILERLLPRFLEEEKKNYINGISFQFSQSTQKGCMVRYPKENGIKLMLFSFG